MKSPYDLFSKISVLSQGIKTELLTYPNPGSLECQCSPGTMDALTFRMQMHLQKVEVDIPVRWHHSVTAVMHVVADVVQSRLLRRRPYVRISPSLPSSLYTGPASTAGGGFGVGGCGA
jgi:hypothetical protein